MKILPPKRGFFLFAYTLLLSTLIHSFTWAQCPGGTTQSQLNWDWLDYLPSNNANYTPSYVLGITPYNQNFSMGTRRLNFTIAPSANITLNGENATHTGHASSFATAGEDVQFTTTSSSNTTITMTFDTDVENVMFSIFDLDASQVVSMSAVNSSAVAQTITMATASGSSGIIVAGSGTVLAIATAPGTGYATTSNNGTINITVPGPVQTITITLSTATGDLWLSDINACVTGSFPSGYRSISRPFTGMPSYILTVLDNVFYQLDPATGRMRELFTDPGHTNMNGMAYDPVNRYVYYTYSLTGSPVNTKTIYRYDVDNETIGTFMADVNAAPLNIPTYTPGVTSGSASFYNGSLYVGFEASNSTRNSGRENTVWKIDFDGSQSALRASQVYATRVDSNISGTNRLIHDWSDIGVTNNGIMYDFDGAGAGTATRDSMYYHFDMMTGQRTQFLPSGAGNIGPKQLGIDWQENVYNMGGLPTSSGTAQNIGGFIVPYNYNGTVNNAQNHLCFTLPGPVYPIGSWGDASEAFRPYCDFGDAPNSYEMPDSVWAPAVHERDTALYLGASFDREWLKQTPMDATGDGTDEDCLPYVPIFAKGYGSYWAQGTVYNNTGGNATVIAWLDYDGNGFFDASEACNTLTVPSSAAPQVINMFWPSTPSVLPNNSYTYLRIRVTRASHGMTSANPQGYYEDGETEDYSVLVDDFPLTVKLLSFEAKVINKNFVKLQWNTTAEDNFAGFDIQRSADNLTWNTIGNAFAKGDGPSAINEYYYNDLKPLAGKSYYRLVMKNMDSRTINSEVRAVTIDDGILEVILFPNPAIDMAVLLISASQSNPATITMTDINGKLVYSKNLQLRPGTNGVDLPVASSGKGIYLVRVNVNDKLFTKKLIISD